MIPFKNPVISWGGGVWNLVNFNPHLHVLAADGAFPPDGRFVTLPAVPGSLLAEGFRHAVLKSDAGCAVAGAAVQAHSRSLRAPRSLRRLVLEPGTRRAGKGSIAARPAFDLARPGTA